MWKTMVLFLSLFQGILKWVYDRLKKMYSWNMNPILSCACGRATFQPSQPSFYEELFCTGRSRWCRRYSKCHPWRVARVNVEGAKSSSLQERPKCQGLAEGLLSQPGQQGGRSPGTAQQSICPASAAFLWTHDKPHCKTENQKDDTDVLGDAPTTRSGNCPDSVQVKQLDK